MRGSAGFLERNAVALGDALEHAASADRSARRPGVLQALDARAKLIGCLALIVTAAGTHRLAGIAALFAFASALGIASRVPFLPLTRVWCGVLGFTGLLALPALFLTPGPALWHVPPWPWPITTTGLAAAARLIARAETTASLAVILVLTTPWPPLLRALRILWVPRVLVVVLGMTHRYIFLLLGLARDYFTARRSRQVGRFDGPTRRRVTVAAAGVLLDRSVTLSDEVYRAMQARGFRGEAHLLQPLRWRTRDTVALSAFVLVAAAGWL